MNTTESRKLASWIVMFASMLLSLAGATMFAGMAVAFSFWFLAPEFILLGCAIFCGVRMDHYV